MRPESYLPPIEHLLLVVPATDKHSIAPRSAIVAQERDGKLVCYYEGGLFGNMAWSEKLTHAASRLAHHYPTTAFGVFSKADMHVVGDVTWNRTVGAWTVTSVIDADAIYAWTGENVEEGPTDEQRRIAVGKLISQGRTDAMIAWSTAKKTGNDPIQAVLNTVGA